ncbi:MAG TPA: hypothetical protein VM305_06850 [Candidatus Limnocylindrales bacterium]|nr:hypothetical protein [Candidatus Limnocylindrales bacterium]
MAGGYVPLTERFLPASWPARGAAIAAYAALPFVRMVAFAGLGVAFGVAPDFNELASARLPGALLNAYILFVVLFGMPIVARQLHSVRALAAEDAGAVTGGAGSIAAPLLIALVLTVATDTSLLLDFGAERVAATPIPFAVAFLLGVLIRIPQTTAFWTSVVTLLAVVEVGRRDPPVGFPDDRSLGLRPVGQALTTILLLYVAAFVPIFIFGTGRLTDFVAAVAVFALGLTAMLLAVWRVHQGMVRVREREVAGARARYAAAYRTAASEPDGGAGSALSTASALLQGAESIHEWPFDERMQRIAGIVLTSVVTGITVRLILLGLGI